MHGLFLGQGWAALCRTAAHAVLPGAAQSPPCARGSGEVAGVGLGQDRRSARHGEEGTCGTALHGGDGTARECQRTPGLMPPPARRGGGRQAALAASSSNLWLNLMGCSVGANNYTEMSSAACFARCPPARLVPGFHCAGHGCPLIYLPGGCSRPRGGAAPGAGTGSPESRPPLPPCLSCMKQRSRCSSRSQALGTCLEVDVPWAGPTRSRPATA